MTALMSQDHRQAELLIMQTYFTTPKPWPTEDHQNRHHHEHEGLFSLWALSLMNRDDTIVHLPSCITALESTLNLKTREKETTCQLLIALYRKLLTQILRLWPTLGDTAHVAIVAGVWNTHDDILQKNVFAICLDASPTAQLTMLIGAIRSNKIGFIREYCSHNLPFSCQDHQKRYVWFALAYFANTEAIRLLGTNGLDLTQKDPVNGTILHGVVDNKGLRLNHVAEVIGELTKLEYGMDLQAKDAKGETALACAIRKGGTPIINALKDAMHLRKIHQDREAFTSAFGHTFYMPMQEDRRVKAADWPLGFLG